MIYKTQKDVEENVKIGKIYKWNNNLEGYLIVEITKIDKTYKRDVYIMGKIIKSFIKCINEKNVFKIYTNQIEKYSNVFEEFSEKDYPQYYL